MKKTNKKPLYDKTIEYSTKHLPKELRDIISDLEKYDETGDWFNYDLRFRDLDMIAKSMMIAEIITRKDYDKLLNKYGWLYD